VIASEKEAPKNLLRLLCDIDKEYLTKVVSVIQSFENVIRVLSCDSVRLCFL